MMKLMNHVLKNDGFCTITNAAAPGWADRDEDSQAEQPPATATASGWRGHFQRRWEDKALPQRRCLRCGYDEG